MQFYKETNNDMLFIHYFHVWIRLLVFPTLIKLGLDSEE